MCYLRQTNGFICFGLAFFFTFYANGYGINMDINSNNSNFELLKKVLKELESSGGVNKNHKSITSGIHKGHTAYGEFGLMPNTAKEITRLKKNKDSSDKALLELPENDLDEYFKTNPKKYAEIIDSLINLVGERSEWDIPTAATMWRWGHNLPKERAMQLLEKNPEYKQRVLNALKRMKGNE